MSQGKIIGAVDIGTGKVSVLVGEVFPGGSMNIIGMGQASSMGVKKGEIVDFRQASDATHAAIIAAEKNAGVHIEAVYMSQSGAHLAGFHNRGSVSVSASDGLVSTVDVTRAAESAKRRELQPRRVYIHHIQNGIRLDDRLVQDPFVMRGETLEVGYWHVHGDERVLTNHIHVVNGFGLEVEDMIISSIASGCMVTTEDEKKAGVLVLDIGCGTTDYALYRNGYAYQTGVVCVGGDHLTNDLSLGLRVSTKHAENLKVQFGKALIDSSDKNDKVWLYGDLTIGDRAIPRLAIYQILKARVEELFQVIKKSLGESFQANNIPSGVIITGGSSRLPYIDDVAARVFGVPAKLGTNPHWVQQELREPEYSTALGLLYHGLSAEQQDEEVVHRSGIIRKVMNIFSFN